MIKQDISCILGQKRGFSEIILGKILLGGD